MTIHVVTGGQFGSEAKGHVAAILARGRHIDGACVRVGGPNAGHSVIDDSGIRWAFRHVPVASVVSDMQLIIGPGSEVDIEVLQSELEALRMAGILGIAERLFVDGQATIITESDRNMEKAGGTMTARLGSTAKGVGAARASRIWRKAPLAINMVDEFTDIGVQVTNTQRILNRCRQTNSDIIVEGTQGYGLGLHAGFYPFCTSGDCRTIDFLAQAGICDMQNVQPWIVCRTFPIRVAGNSGPMFEETTWGTLGMQTDGYIKPEQTTVTKKIRRVGQWDDSLVISAIQDNPRNSRLVLTFVDYLDPALAGVTDFDKLQASPAWNWIVETEKRIDHRFTLFTTGPNSSIWRQ